MPLISVFSLQELEFWFEMWICHLTCVLPNLLLFIDLFEYFAFAVFPWTRWVLNASWRILWSHTFSKSISGLCSSSNRNNVSYQPQKGSWAIWWGKGTEFHLFPKFCWQNCWVFGKYRSDCRSTWSFHELWPLDLWLHLIPQLLVFGMVVFRILEFYKVI